MHANHKGRIWCFGMRCISGRSSVRESLFVLGGGLTTFWADIVDRWSASSSWVKPRDTTPKSGASDMQDRESRTSALAGFKSASFPDDDPNKKAHEIYP